MAVLDNLPETEVLFIMIKAPYSGSHLTRYLETHKELTSLEICIRDGDFPSMPESNFSLKLTSISLISTERLLTDNMIKFIKSQGTTLKKLRLSNFFLELNVVQNLLDSMEKLETISLSGTIQRSNLFIFKDYTGLKLSKMILSCDIDETALFFDMFPNLEKLEISGYPDYGKYAKSAVSKCCEIKKLHLQYANAFLKEKLVGRYPIIDFEIKKGEPIDEDFLLKLQSLETLYLGILLHDEELNERLLKKILTNCKNLNFLAFSVMDLKYESHSHQKAIKKLLGNIWPLLGNLKTLGIRGLDVFVIREESQRFQDSPSSITDGFNINKCNETEKRLFYYTCYI
jgi:hypothetical protein